jgi:hypothetical protein
MIRHLDTTTSFQIITFLPVIIILFDSAIETLWLNNLRIIFTYGILLWYRNKSQEVQIVSHNCVYSV